MKQGAGGGGGRPHNKAAASLSQIDRKIRRCALYILLLVLCCLCLFLRCPGFVLRPSFLALGNERNDWNMYFTDGGSDYNDPTTEDTTFDSTVSSPGFYW